jgi:hypothetical protein
MSEFDFTNISSTYPVYVVLFAVVILYYTLYASRSRGAAVRIVNWWLGSETHLAVGSFGFALLSGRLYANRVEYRTKNVCIMILECTIR